MPASEEEHQLTVGTLPDPPACAPTTAARRENVYVGHGGGRCQPRLDLREPTRLVAAPVIDELAASSVRLWAAIARPSWYLRPVWAGCLTRVGPTATAGKRRGRRYREPSSPRTNGGRTRSPVRCRASDRQRLTLMTVESCSSPQKFVWHPKMKLSATACLGRKAWPWAEAVTRTTIC